MTKYEIKYYVQYITIIEFDEGKQSLAGAITDITIPENMATKYVCG